MKVVKFLLLVFFSLTLIASCNDASSNDPADDKDHVDNGGDSGTGGSGGNTGGSSGGSSTTRDLNDNVLMLDGDSLFLVSKTAQPIFAGHPYRYQLNFATRGQLDSTANDGNPQSTIGFVISFKSRPSVSTNYNYTSARGGLDSLDLNIYLSHWINVGTDRDGQNFLSPNSGNFDLTLEDSRFKAIINSLQMKNEADTTDTYVISTDLDFSF